MSVNPIYFSLDFQGANRASNLAPPQSSGDAATKEYVDNKFGALNYKANVFTASTTNVNIASPGSSIGGATVTTTFPRVGLFGQTDKSQEGIYIWNGASSPMTRADDANTWDELRNAVVTVDTGTLAGVRYRQTVITGTLGTTAMSWQVDSSASPPATTTQSGVSRHATQAEVDAGLALTPNAVVTPDVLASWSQRPRRMEGNIGDGTSTTFNLTHNFNTRFVHVTVFLNSGQYDDILVEKRRTDANTVQIEFTGIVPASNSFSYLISR